MKKIQLVSVVLLAGMLLAACASPQAPEAVSEQPAVQEEVQAEEQQQSSAAEESAVDAEVSFSKDVYPILEQFGSDHFAGKAGVFLKTYADVMKFVVPGNPEESVLYKVLIGDGVPQMPPEGKLADELIQTIYLWIQQGALDN